MISGCSCYSGIAWEYCDYVARPEIWPSKPYRFCLQCTQGPLRCWYEEILIWRIKSKYKDFNDWYLNLTSMAKDIVEKL